jgi:hypothetical protein
MFGNKIARVCVRRRTFILLPVLITNPSVQQQGARKPSPVQQHSSSKGGRTVLLPAAAAAALCDHRE